MQWRTWLAYFGLTAPSATEILALSITAALVGGGFAVGWFVGARVGPRLAGFLRRWAGRMKGLTPKAVTTIVQYAVTVLLMVVIARTAAVTPLALLVAAAATGFAVAMLSFRLFRLASVGIGMAALLSAAALIGAVVAQLGGVEPLTAALDGLGLTIGTRRFTLLAALNFVIVASVLMLVARLANRVIQHSIGRISSLDAAQQALVQKLAAIAVIAAVALLGVDLLGIDLTAFAVFSGALGLAVGFGLQKTLGNLIAGVILLMDRSVKPGDVIVVADTFGTVSKIGVRAVSVITRDGKEHLIPNEQLMIEPVENWSYTNRNVRLHIPVGVSYGCDLALAQKLMIEAAESSPRVLPQPKPSVWLKGFGDSSVDHEILAWISDPEMGVGAVQSEVLNRLWVLFKENGVEIPFPQRDLHIRSLPEPPPAKDAPG